MSKTVLKETQNKMDKAIASTKDRLGTIRAGRASVSMLDSVKVLNYGMEVPLSQVGNISAPEARLLSIEPWDKAVIKDIEKAIQQANLGLNPSNDGKIIRIQIPDLTTERRKEYAKMAKKDIEEGKIGVRSIRKDSNNILRKMQKDGDITEDELKMTEKQVQDLTDKFIKTLDEIHVKKEKEILNK